MRSIETGSDEIDDVDPAIREFHRKMNSDYARCSVGFDGGAVARRNIAEQVREPWRTGGPAMADIREAKTPSGVRMRIYTPNNADTGRVLIYVHGGGWVMFSLDTHDRLMREYAHRAGIVVVGVDYALSPEEIYPRALDDVSSAFEWVAGGSVGSGYEAPSIIIGGDSAGANLAISTAMRLRDEGNQAPAGLLLNYGAYDMQERASHGLYDGDNYMLTCAEMAAFWRDYLGSESPEACAYARPLRQEIAGLPRTFMCIAECDILRDENLEMAKQLRNAGVNVEEHLYAGATHSFLEAVSISSLAEKAFEDAAEWLRKAVQRQAFMKTIVDQDIVRLIREYPLAWVVPQDHRVFPALLPMIAECDSVGAAVSLMGHVPKAHPLTAVFKNDGRTRFLFLGPHGYISPELLSNKDWAPTWNYAAAQIDAEVEIDDNLTGEALNALVEKMEQGRAAPWSVAALGDRYSLLESRVVGFRARILSVQAKFKLGQDEDPTAFSEIVDGLGDLELSSWMKCFRAAD